jgi:hypothetical protein
MRAKRRQELKTNDLAHWLEEKSISWKDWGTYVIGGVALVVVVIGIVSWLRSAKAEAVGHAWTELQQTSTLSSGGIPKTPEEIQQSLQKINELSNQTGDSSFKLDALLQRGNLALASAGLAGADSAKLLEEAHAAYQEVADKYQSYPLHYGRALSGLYQVEAQAFVQDHDSKHETAAASYLEKIRDDARLARTPLNNMAVDNLNSLDRIFSATKFPAKPLPTPRPTIAPVEATAKPAEPAGATGENPTGTPVTPATDQAAPQPSAAPAEGSAPPATPAEPAATPVAGDAATPAPAPAETGTHG